MALPRSSLIVAVLLVITAASAGKAEIKIGYAGPLSGPLSTTGHRNQVAIETAIYALNRKGGVLGDLVELVVADDACGIERAALAAKKMIDAHVDLVIGHICSHSSLIAAGYYEPADVLMITPSSTHPLITEEGRRNVFRLTGRDDDQGRLAGDLLAVACAGRRIAILHDQSTYGVGLAGEMRKRLRGNGVEEALFESYAPNQEHYTELGKRLSWLKADVIYVGGYGPDAARILRSARQAGSDLRMIGGDGLGMDEFWTVAQPIGEGTIFSDRPQPEHGQPDAEHVLAQFEARGLGSRAGGLGAYAAVQTWALAVERIESVEPAEVAKLLRRGHFNTVLGRIGFDRKGDLEGAGWTWYVWTDGTHQALNSPAGQLHGRRLCS